MKACVVTFSLPLLLESLGLRNTNGLTAYHAMVDRNGNIVIGLRGDHPDLPEVLEGQEVPSATIICKSIDSRIEVRG